jgi:L-cysteine desulfidase
MNRNNTLVAALTVAVGAAFGLAVLLDGDTLKASITSVQTSNPK